MTSTVTFDAQLRKPAGDRSAEARGATLGASDLRGAIPRDRGTLARVAIAVCLGVSAIWAWRSYGGHDPAPEQTIAPPAVETSAPPPVQAASIAPSTTTAANEPSTASADHQQIETMARDLADLHQAVQQLAADHEQLTRKIAKLQTEKPQADKASAEKPDKRVLRRVSAHPPAPVAAPVRKPAPITPMPPQATPQVSALNSLSPPSQPASQIPFRPPLRVPQP